MKTSVTGLAFIANEEGWVPRVYKDQVGKETIGYGHLVRPGESFPATITKEQGLALLKQDVGIAEDAINAAVLVPLSQPQFDALVSFTFNVGTHAFKTSTLLKLLNARDYDGSAKEFARWTKGGGKELPVLVARRKRERALFESEPAPEKKQSTGTPAVDPRYDLRVPDPLHLDETADATDPFGLKEPGER